MDRCVAFLEEQERRHLLLLKEKNLANSCLGNPLTLSYRLFKVIHVNNVHGMETNDEMTGNCGHEDQLSGTIYGSIYTMRMWMCVLEQKAFPEKLS
jgi:hypothetical protein